MPVHKLLITPTIKCSVFERSLGPFEVARGFPFSLTLDLENLGETEFPGGSISDFRLTYGSTSHATTTMKVESKCPACGVGQSIRLIDNRDIFPFTDGLAWVQIRIVPEGEQQQVEYYQSKNDNPIDGEIWMSPIYIVNKEYLRIIELLEKLSVARLDSG